MVSRILFALFFAFAVSTACASSSVLQDYVSAPDDSYSYRETGTQQVPGATIHFIEMNSQRWPRGPHATTWTHALAVIVPATTSFNTGLVYVGGGSNDLPLHVSSTELQLTVQIALASRSIVTLVSQTPNQPLVLDDSGTPLSEDALIAASWDRAMDSGDYSQVAYLPMVKAVVRAMDTVQSFTAHLTGQPLQSFVVTGFSKRGAATWLTAAVDNRVRAIAPGVFDFLDIDDQIEHHYAAYGFFAPAVADYQSAHVLTRFHLPEGRRLQEIIDPLHYRHALTIPKFITSSPGDQFFTPDASQLYLQKLEGETRIRYVANSDHSLSTPTAGPQDALAGVLAWYQTILLNAPRANVTWTELEGAVSIITDQVPLSATVWTAVDPIARDFRREKIGPAYQPAPLQADATGHYTLTLATPAAGWAAQFVEFRFAGPAGLPQTFSTPVFISPRSLPSQLVESVNDPRNAAYWRRELDAAHTNSAIALNQEFPFFVMNERIDSVEEGLAFYDSLRPRDRALQSCLATRLNIENGRLGWYSSVAGQPLWQTWDLADIMFQLNLYDVSQVLCEWMNAAR